MRLVERPYQEQGIPRIPSRFLVEVHDTDPGAFELGSGDFLSM